MQVVLTYVDIFDGTEFAKFRDMLDAYMKQQQATGPYETMKADTITEQMENTLWKQGLLGDSNP